MDIFNQALPSHALYSAQLWQHCITQASGRVCPWLSHYSNHSLTPQLDISHIRKLTGDSHFVLRCRFLKGRPFYTWSLNPSSHPLSLAFWHMSSSDQCELKVINPTSAALEIDRASQLPSIYDECPATVSEDYPDGGYGWVCVFISFVFHFFAIGFVLSLYSHLYP
jgi:hypothetical protein